MLLKNLLITTLWLVIPVTVVYAATPLCGSASAVVENWKGEYIFLSEDDLIQGEYQDDEPDELISTAEYDVEPDLIFDEPDLIVDEIEE